MQVEIWSDVVCPWCYLGKRRFESALRRFERSADVDVRWRSFELDPSAPPVRDGDPVRRLADKYGMSRAQAEANNERLTSLAAAEGLEYHLDRVRSGNSFDAHRLLHLAAERDMQDSLKERLFRGYFTETEAIGDRDTLVKLAVDIGLDENEVRDVVESERFGDAVRADEQQAAAYGISGVPFFVIDGRYGVSGAQPADVLLDALRRAAADEKPLTVIEPDADASCTDESCDV